MSQLQRVQPPLSPIDKVIIPEPRLFKLDNGVSVYLIEAGTEKIMRIEFTFKAGQIKEYIPLLASTTNMMLTEGSQNYNSEELHDLLDYYGMFLNMYTTKDSSGIILFCLNKHIEKALELSKEILFNPLFPEKELNSLMQKRLRWYMEKKEKVQNIALDKFFESVFGNGHPYGYSVNETDFHNLSPSILKDFHSKYFTPDNMAVIISGKTHEKTTEYLNYYFGDINSKNQIQENIKVNLLKDVVKKIHIPKPGTVQSAIKIGSATINMLHPDYPGIKVLNSILGGYFGSRLMRNIREDKSYTYGISSSVSSLDLAGYKMISTEVSQKNCQKTIDEIYKEIRLLQTTAVKKDEMTIVRNYMSGEMVRMFDGPFALAESFKSVWTFGLDNNYYNTLANKIRTIDQDEIIDLARTYYNIDDLYEITVGVK
jgi:zinc protease